MSNILRVFAFLWYWHVIVEALYKATLGIWTYKFYEHVLCSLVLEPTTFVLYALIELQWEVLSLPKVVALYSTRGHWLLLHNLGPVLALVPWLSQLHCTSITNKPTYRFIDAQLNGDSLHIQEKKNNKYANRLYLKSHKCTSPAVIAFGPIRSHLDGLLSICEGQRILLQTTVAVGAISKKPVIQKSKRVNKTTKKQRQYMWIWFHVYQCMTCSLSGHIWWPL